MPNPREQAESVAKWMGWVYDPSMPSDMRWQAPRGDLLDAAPSYWRSLDAMREVEDEIERRGLMPRYERILLELWANDSSNDSNINVYLIRATAAQRLQAAYRTIQEAA